MDEYLPLLTGKIQSKILYFSSWLVILIVSLNLNIVQMRRMFAFCTKKLPITVLSRCVSKPVLSMFFACFVFFWINSEIITKQFARRGEAASRESCDSGRDKFHTKTQKSILEDIESVFPKNSMMTLWKVNWLRYIELRSSSCSQGSLWVKIQPVLD